MSYVTIPEIRLLTGLTTTDISNDDLSQLLELAVEFIIKDLTIGVRDEEPTGTIDGSNNTFEVANYPIADVDGDKVAGSLDVTVYQWTIDDDPSTKSSIAVSTVYPRDGKIVVTTAPTTSVKKLSIDYSYTLEKDINWDLVKMAVSYLTGYIFAIKKFTVIPSSLSRGPVRFRYFTKPYDEYLNKYLEVMNQIKAKRHIKKNTTDMQLDRKRLS